MNLTLSDSSASIDGCEFAGSKKGVEFNGGGEEEFRKHQSLEFIVLEKQQWYNNYTLLTARVIAEELNLSCID